MDRTRRVATTAESMPPEMPITYPDAARVSLKRAQIREIE
jgi:hypothetical protein